MAVLSVPYFFFNIMKRVFVVLLLALPMAVAAQVKIGFLSYNEVLQQMPEYAQAQERMSTLKAQYDKEAQSSEEEFQRKFAEFLQGQKDFPQNLLLKRQAELQALMDTNIKFRQEADSLMQKAEQDMLAEVQDRLDVAIEAVGISEGYAAILNTDGNQCPFVSPALGNDVTLLVKQRLGLSVETEQTVPSEQQ